MGMIRTKSKVKIYNSSLNALLAIGGACVSSFSKAEIYLKGQARKSAWCLPYTGTLHTVPIISFPEQDAVPGTVACLVLVIRVPRPAC